MAYHMYIGERCNDENGNPDVIAASRPDAPAVSFHRDPKSNAFGFPFHVWAPFRRATEELDAVWRELFPYNDDVYPWVGTVKPDHSARITAALAQWQTLEPETAVRFQDKPYETTAGAIVAGLEWFAFWTRWAVDNCTSPAMVTF